VDIPEKPEQDIMEKSLKYGWRTGALILKFVTSMKFGIIATLYNGIK
jgi:hypothetical protein